MDKELRVVVVRPGETPYRTIIPNTLEAMQALVEGYIEVVPRGISARYSGERKPLLIICNEEGKLLDHMEPNFYWYGNIIVGPAFVVGPTDSKGDFTSLSEKQAQAVVKFFQVTPRC